MHHIKAKCTTLNSPGDALGKGYIDLARQLLGRSHRMVGYLLKGRERSVVCGGFLNQAPDDGAYSVCVRALGRNQAIRAIARVKRKVSADSEEVIQSEDASAAIENADSVFCDECEVYIDFFERVGD